MYDTKDWYTRVLDHFPHGEEGRLTLNPDDAFEFAKILLRNGFAVCFTSGDIGDDIDVHYLYAGYPENLKFADYDSIVFTSSDYLDDYPKALEVLCDEGEEKQT